MTPTEQLLAHLLGRPWTQLAGHPIVLDERQRQWLKHALDRLRSGEPVAYILQQAPFMEWTFHVGPGVFIPRPDTESWVSDWLMNGPRPQRVHHGLDIGTGSGCLAAVLADQYPEAAITALELSPQACEYARRNFSALGFSHRVALIQTDAIAWLKDHAARQFEVIVSNPPYVPRRRWPHLAETVKAEPILALDGGEDGLDMIRRLMGLIPLALAQDGVFVLEIDDGSEDQVVSLATEAGLHLKRRIRDLTQTVRALVFSVK